MGVAVSKKSHVSYASTRKCEASAIVNAIPNTEYSLTFTGHVILNTPRKSKKINYISACEQIIIDPFWNTFLKEVMRDSILSLLHKKIGEEFYSEEYPPITNVKVILDNKKKVIQNVISGTVYWSSVSTDTSGLADCIATKMTDIYSSNTIEDLTMEWTYHFIPGCLGF